MTPDSKIHELFASALRQHQAGRLAEAEQYYLQTLQLQPRHADALHLLGVLAHQLGRHQQAVELIRRAIAENRHMPAFHNNLGNALKAQENARDAIISYGAALALKPDYVEAHFNLAAAYQAQGNLENAAAGFRQALQLRPGYLEAHLNLGNTLHAQGHAEAAEASFRNALSLNPNHADALNNLGNMLRAQGKLNEAIACYQSALLQKPEHVQAHHNLGVAFFDQGKFEEAVGSFQRALRFSPRYAEAYCHLGNALKELGNRRDAATAYREALNILPQHAESRLALAVSTLPIFIEAPAEGAAAVNEFSSALAEINDWDQRHPGLLGPAIGTTQPFYLAYRPDNVTSQLLSYGELACRAAGASRPEAFVDPTRKSGRARVRMVIVTAHVKRHHPVWEIVLRGLIANLDRQRFEIILYHTGPVTDAETEWARARVDRFVQGAMPLPRWLDQVRHDRPDVIFYPEVGMEPIAGALAALRLAPLQIASWGHPITTGLKTIDLFLSGALLEADDADSHYRESLVRLPGTGVCTETEADSVGAWRGPERRSGQVRLCVCQQPIKFDPADDALYARIARQLPGCEIWLVSPTRHAWAAERLRNRLALALDTEGVNASEVLKVTPWMSRAEFAGFLGQMDVYLDCPAFSGYTTARQAIHHGLPIVTLEGEFLRQRLAAGLLRQAGISEGITHTGEQYVSTAVAFANEALIAAAASRRSALRAAANKVDGNLAAVRMLETLLWEATHR
jgi:protein O-GlcNAc transferase